MDYSERTVISQKEAPPHPHPFHLWGFADKFDALHQGTDGHLEEVAFAVVFCDAAERVHHQQLLHGFQDSIQLRYDDLLPIKATIMSYWIRITVKNRSLHKKTV